MMHISTAMIDAHTYFVCLAGGQGTPTAQAQPLMQAQIAGISPLAAALTPSPKNSDQSDSTDQLMLGNGTS